MSEGGGSNWLPLSAFRDTDDPEFSDRSGEEACRMMLAQWRDEQKGKNVCLKLLVALKELGLFALLSHSVYSQTAAETHSRTSVMRTNSDWPPTGTLPRPGMPTDACTAYIITAGELESDGWDLLTVQGSDRDCHIKDNLCRYCPKTFKKAAIYVSSPWTVGESRRP